jgi:predicted enzyme related to lactoylglutathione lyase
MLKYNKAFSGFAVPDIGQAKKFYGETLGLNLTEGEMGLLELHLDSGNALMIYPKPDFVPATYTILNFKVDDLEKTVNDLTERGAKFEQYGGEIGTDAKGIHRGNGNGPDIAWFKDPAGNILSVIQE